MTDKEIEELISSELALKTLGVTEQYLEILELVYENDTPKISRIDREDKDGLIIVYLPVKNEYFYLAIYINPREKQIQNVSTESRNKIVLRVDSEITSLEYLQSLTLIRANKVWKKGEFWPNNRRIYKSSGFEIEPNPEPDEFEDKLEKLLVYLSNYKEDIITLKENADVWIQVTMDFHNGNQLLGNVFLGSKNLQGLNDLNLEVSFDFAAWGNGFK